MSGWRVCGLGVCAFVGALSRCKGGLASTLSDYFATWNDPVTSLHTDTRIDDSHLVTARGSLASVAVRGCPTNVRGTKRARHPSLRYLFWSTAGEVVLGLLVITDPRTHSHRAVVCATVWVRRTCGRLPKMYHRTKPCFQRTASLTHFAISATLARPSGEASHNPRS